MNKVAADILAHINAQVLTPKDTGGHRDFADLCCDIINQARITDKEVAAKCGLSTGTVKRMRENVKPYNPNTRTVERLLGAYGFSMEVK